MMLNVEVMHFKTGFSAVYVGMLSVGKVTTRPDGKFVVSNDTPCYKGWVFDTTDAICLFTRCCLSSASIPSNMGITYES